MGGPYRTRFAFLIGSSGELREPRHGICEMFGNFVRHRQAENVSGWKGTQADLSNKPCWWLLVVGFEDGGELGFGWLGDPVEGSTVVRVAVGFDDDVASVDSLKDPSFTGGGV